MDKEQESALKDISFYVLELNDLLSEIKNEIRNAYKPDAKKIELLAKEIEVHAATIKELVKS